LADLAVLPFFAGGTKGNFLQHLGWSAVIFAGLLVASRDRKILRFALLIALPVLALRWTAGYFAHPVIALAAPLSGALFLSFMAAVVFKAIFMERRVTLDEIFGGILVYILVGVVFGLLHYALEIASPGAYLLGDVTILSTSSGSEDELLNTFRYYSFTTLTTLGYGDIRPQAQFARMLSIGEALIGQLYLAIFIARLVGAYLSQRGEAQASVRDVKN
jgi:hypothetical protein